MFKTIKNERKQFVQESLLQNSINIKKELDKEGE